MNEAATRNVRLKVLINQPIPYNIDLFNAIHHHSGLSIDVLYLYEQEILANQSFSEYPEELYPHHVLPGFRIGNAAVNPSAIVEIFRDNYDALLIAGYNHPTLAASIVLASNRKKPWMLWGDTWADRDPINPIVRRMKKMLLDRAFTTACAVLATGDPGVESVIRRGCRPDRAVNFPYTVDPERILRVTPSQLEFAQRLKSKAGGRPILLCVGQLIPRKGPDILLKAALKLKEKGIEFYVVFAGTGEMQPSLRELADKSRLGSSVEFTGFLQQDELMGCYRAADVFVLPALWDAWGVVVNEAMVFGLPVVTTTACMAGHQLIKDGYNGFLVPPNEPIPLSDAVEKLLAEPSQIKNFGHRAQDTIKDWSPVRNAEILYKLLVNAVAH